MNAGLLLAAVRLAAPFTDGAVLQRGAEVNVWGEAAANETVTVSFGDARAEAVAGTNGIWRAKLPPLTASREGRTLQASAASGTAAARNVVVGEVWIAAGQSNMGIPLWGESPRARDRLGGIVGQITHRKDMRTANLDNEASVQPQRQERIRWQAAEPDFLLNGRAKAVSTWFGLTLERTLDVPVGIFCAQVGATCIETWIPDCHEPSQPRHLSQPHQLPSRLFNGKVAPIVPYTVRGMIWYQGESNSGEETWPKYCTRMHQLIDGWRKEFGNPKMPIYFAQLAPWGSSNVPYIQCEQARFAAEDPYAALAVICDAGNLADIHPNDKQVVALRLALHALRRDYGYDIVSDSPTLARWRIEGGRFKLAFDHVKEWSVYDPDWLFRADPSKTTHLGFEVAGADGRWVKARLGNLRRLANVSHVEYRGQIDGAELEVWADEVPHPQQLRYLFSRPWKGMLYNEVGLPVGPFQVPSAL